MIKSWVWIESLTFWWTHQQFVQALMNLMSQSTNWWVNHHFESSIQLSNRIRHVKIRIPTNFHKILWSHHKVLTFIKSPSSQSLFHQLIDKSCIVDRKAHWINESALTLWISLSTSLSSMIWVMIAVINLSLWPLIWF